jgi:DNA-binding transcriptional ArsR family regulator
MLEKKLAIWLANKNYECFYNFPLGGKFPDLIAIKNKELVAFEFKGHVGEREIPTAIGQCLFYLRDANKAYIVIPKDEENLLASSVIETLRDNGIGLISINDNDIKNLLEAKEFHKNNISIIEKIENRKAVKKIKMKIDVKNKIIDILKEHPEGLTVNSISKLLQMSRTTISKYTYGLMIKNAVCQRKVGTSKICYLKAEENERK